MALHDFDAFLLPTKELGHLHYYSKSLGAITKSVFSRANISASSGAVVIRDGIFHVLGTHEPDWSEAETNGCSSLLFRPFLENQSHYSEIGAASSPYSISSPWRFFSNVLEYEDNSVDRITPIAGVSGTSFVDARVSILVFARLSSGSGAVPVPNHENNTDPALGDFLVRVAGNPNPPLAETFDMGDGLFAFSFLVDSVSPSTDYSLEKLTSNSSNAVQLGGVVVSINSPRHLTPLDYIPTSGAPISRSSNKSDGSVASLTGADAFSVFFKLRYRLDGRHELDMFAFNALDNTWDALNNLSGANLLDAFKTPADGSVTPSEAYPQIIQLFDVSDNLVFRVSAVYDQSLVLVDELSGEWLDLGISPGDVSKLVIFYDGSDLSAAVDGSLVGSITVGARNKIARQVLQSSDTRWDVVSKETTAFLDSAIENADALITTA